MQLVNLNNSYFLKQNDTATQIKLGVLDYEGNPFPLDTAEKVEVVIGVEEGRVLVKEASLLSGIGEIEFGLDEGDLLPVGDNRLEVHIYTSNGEKHVVPSKGYYKLRVQEAIDDLDVQVTTYTLDYFLDQVNKITEGLPETIQEAQRLTEQMQMDLDEVAQLKVDAQEAANLFYETRDVANQIIDDMTTLKAEAEKATTDANLAATNATNATNSANVAADNANLAAERANNEGDYAKEQGDYAKAQAELIDDILEQGPVVSVNGKTGNVILTAEDVNAIPISEKGVAGGVARLNEEGKVIDANGNEVEGKVKSVNGMIGDIVGLETVEGATQKANQAEVNAKAYTDQQIQLVIETSIPKLVRYAYTLYPTTENQTTFEIPLDIFDAETDSEVVVKNTVTLDPNEDYTIEGKNIVLNEPVPLNTRLTVFIYKTIGEEVEDTPTEQRIYGVRIDKNNSNPETRVTYIGDAVGFTPMRGNDGNFQWGSWQSVFESFEIRPCVLKNKQVQYYLDPNDFNKKIDGSPANLTGADGDVMIEFGKPLWWKWTDEGTTYTIEISDKAFDGAVKHAFEIEEGYNLVPYYPLLLTQILFVIFFKSTDSQTALGRGYVDGNTSHASTGNTNNSGMFYGSGSGKQQMKFLGIEDYWGNKFWWIDGLVTDSNYNLLIGKGNFNDNGSGYQSFTSGVSSNINGYINSVQGGNEKGFISKTNSGSETTYYTDYGALYSARVARFGGDRSIGSNAGFALLRLNDSGSYSNANFGARLFCASNGKIYIGTYLGTSVDGKLRSISGTTEPTGNKTIGTFRTEAQANN